MQTILRRYFANYLKDTGYFQKVVVGNVTTERYVPDFIKKPTYYYKSVPVGCTVGKVEIKNEEQITRMRASCKLAANILKSCKSLIKEGVTTDEIDAFVHENIINSNAYPSPLRYAGFPKSVCTSVNNVACHGIPDDRTLCKGDIVNVDVTVFLNGFHGDCSKTFLVDNVDESGRYLVECTEDCVLKTINKCGPGVPLNTIGQHISTFCEKKGLNIIPIFVGHGIGEYFHGPPEIYHYENYGDGVMSPGMVFTIEPILTFGGHEIEIMKDGWTAMTLDGSRTSQHEHTILITDTGAEILTTPD